MTTPLHGRVPHGTDTYAGERIRCSHWDDRIGLGGRRVAVVGSGAAVARVLPAVVARARRVTVFQHDPVWILPRPPIPVPGSAASVADLVPGPRGGHGLPGRVVRLAARANLRLQVRDSWVRRQLTPDIPGTVQWHNHYYEAVQRPTCKLVTWPIAALAPQGIRTVDGIEHRVDCIVFAEDPATTTHGAGLARGPQRRTS